MVLIQETRVLLKLGLSMNDPANATSKFCFSTRNNLCYELIFAAAQFFFEGTNVF